MADAKAKHTEIVNLTGVRMFHPNLIVPRKFKNPQGIESGEPKYSAMFAIDPSRPEFASLKELAKKVALAAAFEDEDGNVIPLSGLAFPFSVGDKLADKAKKAVEAGVPKAKLCEYMRGLVIVKARTLIAPALSYITNGRIVDIDVMGGNDEVGRKKNAGKFFFGAEVWAEITLSAHQVGNNKPGVNAYLNTVIATGKGERIGGAAPASERFKGYLGQLSGEDPTAGASDDVPWDND